MQQPQEQSAPLSSGQDLKPVQALETGTAQLEQPPLLPEGKERLIEEKNGTSDNNVAAAPQVERPRSQPGGERQTKGEMARFFGADDMLGDMKDFAVESARQALSNAAIRTNKERAQFIKKKFDQKYAAGPSGSGGKWHCIVGTDFGSYVTHEAQNFVFFQLGAYFVLIFKA